MCNAGAQAGLYVPAIRIRERPPPHEYLFPHEP